MITWSAKQARAEFSKLLNAARVGPQIITRNGRELAVLLSTKEWRRLQRAARPSLKALLLAPEPRFENLAPKRGRLTSRLGKESAFAKYRGIGSRGIGSGKKNINRWLRELRGGS